MPGGTFCQRDQDIMSFSLIKNKIRNNKKVLKPHRKADVSFQKKFHKSSFCFIEIKLRMYFLLEYTFEPIVHKHRLSQSNLIHLHCLAYILSKPNSTITK